MFLAAGGREQTAEEEIDGAGAELARRDLQALHRRGLEEALHGLKIKFDGEGAVQVGSHHAGELTFLDEAAENVGNVFLPHLLDETVQLGGEALEIAHGARIQLREALCHALGEAAEFFGKVELAVAEK